MLTGRLARIRSDRDEQLYIASRVLTAIAAVSLIGGVATSRLVLDDYGLSAGLSTMYWVGLVAMPLASIVEWLRGDRASPALMIGQVATWFLVVWSTPLWLEGTPRFRTSYVNYGYVDPLVRTGALDGVRFLYHNWPLFPILVAGLVRVGISPEFILAVFPIVAVALYLGTLGALLVVVAAPKGASLRDSIGVWRQQRRLPVAWGSLAIAFWLFVVLNWTGQDYFSPQALAYLLFLGLMATLAVAARAPDRRLSMPLTALALGLFTAIVATHVLTSLYALAILAALTLTGLLRPWTLLTTAGVIFIVWQVQIAAPFYGVYAERLLEGIFRATAFFDENVAQRVGGSAGHEFVVRLRIIGAGIVFALGALAAVILALRRQDHEGFRFVAAALLGIAVVTPISIYGGEALIRGLLFMIPFVIALVVLAGDTRLVRVALAGAILIGAPLHVFTHYGNELYDYVSPDELAGFNHVAEMAPANVYGGFPAGAYQNTSLLDSRNASLPRQGASTIGDYLAPQDHAWARRDWPVLVAITRGDHAALRLFRNDTTLLDRARAALDSDDRFEVEFVNEDIVVYRWLGDLAVQEPP